MTSLSQRLLQDGFDGYTYSYPHKTAYRPLDPPVPLRHAWQQEDTSDLFLYVHLPFCEMRCGFCNLFTTVNPKQNLVERTLSAIERQSLEVSRAVNAKRVSRAAFGGGTPSFLQEQELEQLFARLAQHWPVDWGSVPVSFETSPGTLTPRKLALLKKLGVTRLSMGVQSFVAEDLAELGRPSLGVEVERVAEWIRDAGFPIFNLDLIYGNPGQDERRWAESLERALAQQPDELYLYPLYVGKLTGLDRLGRRPGERRLALYRQGRDRLLQAGFQQLSMRHFRRSGPVAEEGDYCCQEDGMIGLGPGARSYTRALHYSSEYAVGQSGVREIISAFGDADFAHASYGVRLSLEEQRRRDLLKSLLREDGLEVARYRARFQSDPVMDFPALEELLALGLAVLSSDRLKLTAEGLARSDTLGPWLYSEAVQADMREYEFR